MLSVLGWSCCAWQVFEEAQMRYTLRALLSEHSLNPVGSLSWIWRSCSSSAARLTPTRTVIARRLAVTLTLPCYVRQLSPSVRPLMSWQEETVLIQGGFEVLSVLPRPTIVLHDWTECLDSADFWDHVTSSPSEYVTLLLEAVEDEPQKVLEARDQIPQNRRVHLDNLITRLAWTIGPPLAVLIACPRQHLLALFQAFVEERLITPDPLRLDQLLIVRCEGRPRLLLRTDSTTDFPVTSRTSAAGDLCSPVVTYSNRIPGYKQVAKKLSLTALQLRESLRPRSISTSSSDRSSSSSGDEESSIPQLGRRSPRRKASSTGFTVREKGPPVGLNIFCLVDNSVQDSESLNTLKQVLKRHRYAVCTLKPPELSSGLWTSKCVLLCVPQCHLLLADSQEFRTLVNFLTQNGRLLLDSDMSQQVIDVLRKMKISFISRQQGFLHIIEHPQSGGMLIFMDQTVQQSAIFLREALQLFGVELASETSLPPLTSWTLLSSDESTFNKLIFSLSGMKNPTQFKLSELHFNYNHEESPNHVLLSDRSDHLSSMFNSQVYFDHLSTQTLGRSLLFADVCNSNYSTVLDLLPHLPSHSGLVAVASQQLSGRGRGGNSWISPRGSLLFTYHVTVPLMTSLGQRASLLQHLVGLGVVLGLDSLLGRPCGVALKWPNDLMVSSKGKVGGVLVQSSVMSDHLEVVVGVGLNLFNPEPLGYCLLDKQEHGLEHCLAAILGRTEDLLLSAQLSDAGVEELRQLYMQHWIHDGQHVEVRGLDGLCKIVGVDTYGFLMVESELDSQRHTLHPDGNSFDMMRGLILPKDIS